MRLYEYKGRTVYVHFSGNQFSVYESLEDAADGLPPLSVVYPAVLQHPHRIVTTPRLVVVHDEEEA